MITSEESKHIERVVITASMLFLITCGLLSLMIITSGCMGIQAPVGLSGMPKIDIPVTQPPNSFYENPSAVRVAQTPTMNTTNLSANVTTTKPRFVYV